MAQVSVAKGTGLWKWVGLVRSYLVGESANGLGSG